MVRISTRIGALLIGAGGLCAALAAPAAHGATYNFTNITSNGAASVAIGVSQITMDVADAGAGYVLFTINNSGPSASSICNVYWDDAGDALGSMSAIINSGNAVKFASGGSPPNVPGWQGVSFGPDFRVRANNPMPSKGINPGESLGVKFALAPGAIFSDVLSDIDAGALRVAMHVIAFANGESESFINEPPDEVGMVPLPTPLGLAGAGLVLAAGARRRRPLA